MNPKRQWLQFSLWHLIATMTVIGVGVGGYRWFTLPSICIPTRVVDVGDLKADSKGECWFEIRNSGSRPVEIRALEWSCACGFDNLSVIEIAPRKSHRIKVWWKVRGEDEGSVNPRDIVWNFRLATSDPNCRQVDLAVKCRRTP